MSEKANKKKMLIVTELPPENGGPVCLVTGNTFPCRGGLKNAGARWVPQEKGWKLNGTYQQVQHLLSTVSEDNVKRGQTVKPSGSSSTPSSRIRDSRPSDLNTIRAGSSRVGAAKSASLESSSATVTRHNAGLSRPEGSSESSAVEILLVDKTLKEARSTSIDKRKV